MKGNSAQIFQDQNTLKLLLKVIGINLLKKLQPAHISILHAGCLIQEITLSM